MISVIMWDANFREFTHTIDCFANQTLNNQLYEIIWVDFYNSNKTIKNKIAEYDNIKLLTLNNNESIKWQSGTAINEAVAHASGDLIVIPDGDIVAEPDLLEYIADTHKRIDELVLYFRRFDELEKYASSESRSNIDYLKENSRLLSPTNYFGCFTIKKEYFEIVKGFEMHKAFTYGGDNGIEMYTRLCNYGMAIKWSNEKFIYHPWHRGYGTTTDKKRDKKRKMLQKLKSRYNWISLYGGIDQSWIINCRKTNLDFKSDVNECNKYLSKLPLPLRLFSNHY